MPVHSLHARGTLFSGRPSGQLPWSRTGRRQTTFLEDELVLSAHKVEPYSSCAIGIAASTRAFGSRKAGRAAHAGGLAVGPYAADGSCQDHNVVGDLNDCSQQGEPDERQPRCAGSPRCYARPCFVQFQKEQECEECHDSTARRSHMELPSREFVHLASPQIQHVRKCGLNGNEGTRTSKQCYQQRCRGVIVFVTRTILPSPHPILRQDDPLLSF